MTSGRTLENTVKAYKGDKKGNFAAIGATCAMLLMAAVGVAIDTNGMIGKQSTLQDVLDNAVLSAAATSEIKKKKLKAAVKDSMDQNNSHGWIIETKVRIKNNEIIATANTTYDPVIMGMFRKGPINVKAKSAAPVAQSVPLNISLVLDTTDSMAGTNITDMQNAAERLVDVVKKSKNPDTRIAVVPFGKYVNIGIGRRNESWMNVQPDGTLGPKPGCYEEHNSTATGCQPGTETRYKDGVPYTANIQTGCTWTSTPTGNTICPPAPVLNWHGCAGSREAPHNIVATANASTPIGGAMNETCGEELLPLTNDMDKVKSTIANLTTDGSTHIPSGLIWGWRTLSPDTPFTQATSTPTNATRALVLMTDGANTMIQTDRYDSAEDMYHRAYSPSETTADKQAITRIEGICDGIKGEDILVFTIAYKLPSGSKGADAVLKDCATSPDYTFKANNKMQLKKAFEGIARNLMTVRLSR